MVECDEMVCPQKFMGAPIDLMGDFAILCMMSQKKERE